MQCPCCSGHPYAVCCEPFHQGALPLAPLQLMRSRYSAYALNNVSYIQKTTHPKNPSFSSNTETWAQNIASFCQETKFIKLEILDHGATWVSFKAHLLQNGQPLILQEISHFEKVASAWRYRDGEVQVT